MCPHGRYTVNCIPCSNGFGSFLSELPMQSYYQISEDEIVRANAELERLRKRVAELEKREDEYCRKRCFGHGEEDVTNWVTEAAYLKLEAKVSEIERDSPNFVERCLDRAFQEAHDRKILDREFEARRVWKHIRAFAIEAAKHR